MCTCMQNKLYADLCCVYTTEYFVDCHHVKGVFLSAQNIEYLRRVLITDIHNFVKIVLKIFMCNRIK